MKQPPRASAEAMLDLSLAVIDLYFRLEAITQATAGFAQAGGEYGILRSLVTEGRQTVPEMARSRPVSRQYCQSIVNALATRGLVEFVHNPRHRKSKLVQATDAGRAHFGAMTAQFTEAARAFTPHFNASEVASAADVCRRARALIAV